MSPGDNIYSQNPKSIRVLDTYCYLLPCRDGYLLVDTGYPGKWKAFEKGLERINIRTSEIRYIFLTHHHNDHSGLVSEIRGRTGAPLIVHREEVVPLSKGISIVGKSVNRFVHIAKKIYSIFTDYTYPPVKIRENDHLVDGDDQELLHGIGCDGIILHTPGHTKGSLSILLPGGTLIAGDAVTGFSKTMFASPLPIIIDSMDDLFCSWQKIKSRGVHTLLPSHGRAVSIDELIFRNPWKRK
ncbi:MAG: MBL fold metallo-hydrolase [Candidatus Aureabacteria bacterium]|nr:MBL fold metallo-hydrolase [Candidatus Auribacterota bacterium]